MLLGVLGTVARLRLYPMNLICIMTAQGNGMVFIVLSASEKPFPLGCIIVENNENHNF